VTGETNRVRGARLSRLTTGERVGGFVYGTIVVLAVVVGGARAYPHGAGHIAALAAFTAAALWLAHVYAHGLGESLALERRISTAELRHIARREGSIIEAALPPIGALVLGSIGVVSTRVAVWLAFGLGLVVLAVEGLAVARAERLGGIGTLAVVAANLSFGVLLVGLKLLLTH
jgi:hypothetical protein